MPELPLGLGAHSLSHSVLTRESTLILLLEVSYFQLRHSKSGNSRPGLTSCAPNYWRGMFIKNTRSGGSTSILNISSITFTRMRELSNLYLFPMYISDGMVSFNLTMQPEEDLATAATCTTCRFKEDKSNYWTAVMYFKHQNGTFMRVRTIDAPMWIPADFQCRLGPANPQSLHWIAEGGHDSILYTWVSSLPEGNCLPKGKFFQVHFQPLYIYWSLPAHHRILDQNVVIIWSIISV